MADIVLIFDAEGGCINIAPTNPALLDHSTMRFIRKAVYDLFLADHADRLQHLQPALAWPESISWTFRLAINQADMWFAANIAPLDAARVIFSAHDITEQKRTEAALQQLAAIVE